MTASNLVLVRHSAPVVDLKVPSDQWSLSEEGIAAAKALGLFLELGPGYGKTIWSSGEIKAQETASHIGGVLGLAAASDPRLGEVSRPLVESPDDYRDLALRYLGGESVPGWESASDAVSRLTEGIDELTRKHEGDHLLVVTHGLVMSLYLAAIEAVDPRTRRPVEPGDFRSTLEMPDAWRLDLERGWLDRIGYTWDGSPIASEPPHGAAVLAYRRTASGIEFLLLHRAGAPDRADWSWTPPSGARHPGEDVLACAIRELAEETGLDLSPQPSTTGNDNWPQFLVEVPPNADVRLSAEHDRWEWVAAEEACERCLPAVVSDAMRRGLDYLSKD